MRFAHQSSSLRARWRWQASPKAGGEALSRTMTTAEPFSSAQQAFTGTALSVDVAVERGVEVADHFDLCGQIFLAQKRTLIGQRNPEFSDVAENLAPDWINGDPERPFAVRRLLPWVHLRHGASYRFEARRTVTLLLTASVRFRTFAGGFPHSPQRPMCKRAALHRG
jgi:hypothetical protein